MSDYETEVGELRTRPWLALLLAAAFIIAAVAWCTTRTGIATDSRKTERADEARKQKAAAAADAAYQTAKAHEDTATTLQADENRIVHLSAADTARVRELWSKILAPTPRPAPHPVLAPASQGSGVRR